MFNFIVMKRFLVFFVFFGINILYSQSADNWVFGRNAGLQFIGGNDPISFDGSTLNTLEGCSSFSDDNGELMFYSDGSTVWNKNHEIMPNGTDLGGNDSSSQSGLIVPNPLDNGIYYLFTVDASGSGLTGGLNYNTIDMTTDGGLGSVISGPTNISDLFDDDWSEKVTAVEIINADEYWLISFSHDTFYSFKVTIAGVDIINPVISIGFNDSSDSRGYLKVSPDGSKLAAANMNSGTYLYDFNIETGVVTNEYMLDMREHRGYGIEFSADSSKLYIGTGGFSNATEKLFQFDLESSNINTSKTLIYSYHNSRGALQLGSNGKIYWASNNAYSISVINNPDELGLACNFSFQTVSLGTNRSGQGLPPFIQSLFSTSFLVNTVHLCEGDTYLLEAITTDFPNTTTYTWFLDDVLLPETTNTITLDNITYGSGVYRLEVDYNDGTPILTEETIVQYFNYPDVNTPITVQLCDSDLDGFLITDLTLIQNDINAGLVSSNFTYYLTQDDAENEINQILEPTNIIVNTTDIWVRVEVGGGCFSLSKLEIDVSVSNAEFTNTYNECDDFLDINGNDNLNNDNADGISSFDFSDTTVAIVDLFLVSHQSNISVHYYPSLTEADQELNEITTITNYRNIISPHNQRIYIRINNSLNNQCSTYNNDLFIDLVVGTIPVINSNKPENIIECDKGFDTAVFNLEDNMRQITDTDVEIFYYTSELDLMNEQNEIINPSSFSNTEDPQNIYVKVVNSITGCYGITDFLIETENCPPTIPEGFSPNNDGINDTFTMTGLHDVFVSFDIFIYNRFGNLVFEGNNTSTDWDGTHKGKALPSGTYFYILNFHDDKNSFGSIKKWIYISR